jgi:hypothetical protein
MVVVESEKLEVRESSGWKKYEISDSLPAK